MVWPTAHVPNLGVFTRVCKDNRHGVGTCPGSIRVPGHGWGTNTGGFLCTAMSSVTKPVSARSAGLGIATFATGLAILGFVFTAMSTHELNVSEQLTAAIVLAAVTGFLCASCAVLMHWHMRTEKALGQAAADGETGAAPAAFAVFVNRLKTGVRQSHLNVACVLLLVAVVLYLDAKEHNGASASEVLQHVYDRIEAHNAALTNVSNAQTFTGFSSLTDADAEIFEAEMTRAMDGCLDFWVVLLAEVVALAVMGVAGILMAGETAASLAEAIVRATIGRMPCARPTGVSRFTTGVLQGLTGIVSLGMLGGSLTIILDMDRLPSGHIGWQIGAWCVAGVMGVAWLILALREPKYAAIANYLAEEAVSGAAGEEGDDQPAEIASVSQDVVEPAMVIERAALLRDVQHLFLVSLVGAAMVTFLAHGKEKVWNPAAILLPVLVGMLGATAGSRILSMWAARMGLFPVRTASVDNADSESEGVTLRSLPRPKDVSALGHAGAWLVFCLISMSAVTLLATVASLVGWLTIQHQKYYWIPSTLGGIAFLTLIMTVVRSWMLRKKGDHNASDYDVLTQVAGSSLAIVIGASVTCVAFETAWRLDEADAHYEARRHAAVVQGVLFLLLSALAGPYNLFDSVKWAVMLTGTPEERAKAIANRAGSPKAV